MTDIFLYQGEASPNDVKLSDPTVQRSSGTVHSGQAFATATALTVAAGSPVLSGVASATGIATAAARGVAALRAIAQVSGIGLTSTVGRLVARCVASLSGTGITAVIARLVAKGVSASTGTAATTANPKLALKGVSSSTGTGVTTALIRLVARGISSSVGSALTTLGGTIVRKLSLAAQGSGLATMAGQIARKLSFAAQGSAATAATGSVARSLALTASATASSVAGGTIVRSGSMNASGIGSATVSPARSARAVSISLGSVNAASEGQLVGCGQIDVEIYFELVVTGRVVLAENQTQQILPSIIPTIRLGGAALPGPSKGRAHAARSHSSLGPLNARANHSLTTAGSVSIALSPLSVVVNSPSAHNQSRTFSIESILTQAIVNDDSEALTVLGLYDVADFEVTGRKQ